MATHHQTDVCSQRQLRMTTVMGAVDVYVPVSAGFVDSLEIDRGMGAFCDYRDNRGEKNLLHEIAGAPDGYVGLAVVQGTVVGFILLCQPNEHERWAGVPGVYELSLEVARSYRQFGLSHGLLLSALSDPVWDARVVVAQGYHWHWDIEQSGLAVGEYRRLFQRIFEAHGFTVFDSDDPEFFLDSSNILMARIGRHCPRPLVRGFYGDLFRKRHKPEWLESLLKTA